MFIAEFDQPTSIRCSSHVVGVSDVARVEPILRELQQVLVAKLEPVVGNLTTENSRHERFLRACARKGRLQPPAIFPILDRRRVSSSQIELVRGQTSAAKRFLIRSLTPSELAAKIAAALSRSPRD